MKIWTSEHVFGHNWETVTQSQWRKYPNPHNTSVLCTDVLERRVDANSGVMHTHRVITSDWKLASWVQILVGSNCVAYGHEYSMVDPVAREMSMRTRNLTFGTFVNMDENMSYTPHPDDPEKTLLKQETVVTVQGVPLTDYMESIIVNTVSRNAAKGRTAIDWVVDRLASETRNLSESLDTIKADIVDFVDSVEDKVIATAKKSIDELQRDLIQRESLLKDLVKSQPLKDLTLPLPMLQAQEACAAATHGLTLGHGAVAAASFEPATPRTAARCATDSATAAAAASNDKGL